MRTTGREVRLSSSHKLFGQERETVDEAYAGDIVGLVGHSKLGIGDTLTEDPAIVYHEIPRFPPECFAYLHNPNPGKFKQFRKGTEQLLQEGVIQIFHLRNAGQRVPLLAAVGPLQFEVVQYRLESEYGAPSRLEIGTVGNAEMGAARHDGRRNRCAQAADRVPGCRGRGTSAGDPFP